MDMPENNIYGKQGSEILIFLFFFQYMRTLGKCQEKLDEFRLNGLRNVSIARYMYMCIYNVCICLSLAQTLITQTAWF